MRTSSIYKTCSLLIVVFAAAFTTCTFLVNKNISADAINIADATEISRVRNINTAISLITQNNQEIENIASAAIYRWAIWLQNNIRISNETTHYTAINQETNQSVFIKVNKWQTPNQTIHRNDAFSKQISQNDTHTDVTIFQRFDDGFIRISTSLISPDGLSAAGTYIPNSSPVTQTLLSGKPYHGLATILLENYRASYYPIIKNNKVIGAIFSGKKYIDPISISNVLRLTIDANDEAFTILLNNHNKLIVDVANNELSDDVSNTFPTLKSQTTEYGKFTCNINNKTTFAYFCHIPSIDSYVVTYLSKDIILRTALQQKNNILSDIALSFLACLIFSIAILFIRRKRLSKYNIIDF